MESAEEINEELSIESGDKDSIESENLRLWTFTLQIKNYDLCPIERVGITGNCKELGRWNPKMGLLMTYNPVLNLWEITIEIPQNKTIYYRFFIFAFVPNTECHSLNEYHNRNQIGNEIVIRFWETHFYPHEISPFTVEERSCDTFGLHANGNLSIDRGWLNLGSIVQFKFFYAPFVWKREHRIVYVKITPMCFNIPCGGTQVCLAPLICNESPVVFVEVTNMKFNDCIMKVQPEFGVKCGPDDMILFHITVSQPESIAYVIDFYASAKCAASTDVNKLANTDESPIHLGCHCVLPMDLEKQNNLEFPGNLKLPIMCKCCDRKLGEMNIGFVIINPFRFNNMNRSLTMEKSFQRYWRKNKIGVNIAHFGTGTSFKYRNCLIRQNTISSFKNSVDHGADMIHFTVMVSKDHIPFIYHDFNIYVNGKLKKGYRMNELKKLPIAELEFNQIANMKLFHLIENGEKVKKSEFGNEDILEHRPFPKLLDALQLIDVNVDFMIEIKWPQKYLDNTRESEIKGGHCCNFYIDYILNVIFCVGGKRRIILSSLHPDICTMLKYKQNVYPVVFITQGTCEKFKLFKDPRCHSIETALCYVNAMEFLGTSCYTEELIRSTTLFNLAKLLKQIMFTWGDQNDAKKIKFWKLIGMHGIIFDKINFLLDKASKQNTFKEKSNDSGLEYLKALQEEPAIDKSSFPENNYTLK